MSLPGMNEERRPESIDLVRFVGIVEWYHAADLTHACDLQWIIPLTAWMHAWTSNLHREWCDQ